MKQNSSGSYMMLIGAMLIFGTIGIFRRYIPLSSGVLAFTRGILGAMVLLVFIKIKKRRLCNGIGIKKVLLLALSGALIGANWILLFEAYNYTTVATATLCYYMEPTIVLLLSPLIFRERLTLKKGICAIVSIAGMVFISGILSGSVLQLSDIRGVLLGLGAAVLYSSVVILNKLIPIEDAYEKTIIQLLAAAIVMIPYLLLTENFADLQFTALSIVMILIVGIIHTGIAYALYFASLQKLKGQSIAVLSYIDPVFALILSAVVLQEN